MTSRSTHWAWTFGLALGLGLACGHGASAGEAAVVPGSALMFNPQPEPPALVVPGDDGAPDPENIGIIVQTPALGSAPDDSAPDPGQGGIAIVDDNAPDPADGDNMDVDDLMLGGEAGQQQ